MKFIQVNDVHLSDKAPRWRTDNYAEDVLEKLAWVGTHARSFGADVVVFAGDLFHNPTPHRTSHALIQRLLEVFAAYPCPIVVIPGNHDLSHGSLSSLARQPLGVVAKHPNVTLLSSENPLYLDHSGRAIMGLEWRHYETVDWYREQVERVSKDELEGYGPDALVIHGSVADRGNPFYTTLDTGELAGLSRYLGYGHLHPPDDVREVGGTVFGNPGALSRGSISASDLERTPQVAEVTIDSGGVVARYVECPVAKPSGEIFRLEAALLEKEESEKIAQFVQQLGTATIERVTLESLIQTAESLADSPRVAKLARDILMSAV